MRHQLSFSILCLMLTLSLSVLGCGGGSDKGSSSSGTSSSSGSDTDSSSTSTGGGESDDDDTPVATEGWGHLKGKFVISGAPEATKLAISGTDTAFCGMFEILDESVVASENGGLANVVLLPYVKRGAEVREPHESYADSATATVTLDNKGCRFEPHVAVLRTGQTLKITNSDTVGHNTNIKSEYHPINPIISPGRSLEDDKFTEAERLPVSTSCNIHPWMQGWLVVSDSPYAKVSDENGEFLIENLPAGKHTFTVWHEKCGYLSDVEVDGESKTWARGRVEVTITDGETTDLGEVKVTYEKLSST